MASGYKIEHISNANPTPVVTDVTPSTQRLDNIHFYSDGRISTAVFTLRIGFGDFVTNDNGGATPILANFDRFRITWTGRDGLEYKHIFEIMDDLGQLTNESQYLLPLTLEGRERNLALIPFSGFFDDPPLTHFAMVEKILETYAISRIQPLQPVIDTENDALQNTNLLPQFNPNIWDYLYIDNCLDALQVVVRLANQSVAAGGGGDRFAIMYEDSTTAPFIKMSIRFISQGSNNASGTPPIIRANDLTSPIPKILKVKRPLTGTVVIARGRPGTAGTPTAGDFYRSKLEFFQRIQARFSWDTTVNYRKDSHTSFNNIVYKAKTDNSAKRPDLNPSDWATVSAGQFIGDLQYSRFTIDKATLYKNECTHPTAAFASESEDSPKMLDCNIVINDAETERDWVHIRQITDNVASWSADEKHYLFRQADIWQNFRILVDTLLGAPSGIFAADTFGTGAGKDPNGKPYANNTAVFVNGKWYVIREHQDFDQVLVRFEGLFEFNVNFAQGSRFPASDTNNVNRRLRQAGAGAPDGWRTLNGQFLSNDCLHSPSSITNITGLIDPVAKDGGGFYTDNSAVRIIYEYSSRDDMPEWRKTLDRLFGIIASNASFITNFAIGAAQSLYDLFLTPYYRNVGWWWTMSAPFPFSSHNGISEQVGELYGAGTSLLVKTLDNHNTFDAFNQTYTPTGKPGWNEDDSIEMMEITGVSFLFRLDITANGNTIPYTGDIPCSYWCIDDNGTIWKSKKKYRQIGDVQRMTFNFGDFSPVYRARTPFGINNIITNILTPELEIRERLFGNRIRIQGFQLEGSYDDKGRYMPNLWETIIKPTIFTMFDNTTVTTNVKFIGDIDYFQWVKTPIAISKQAGATRAIFSEVKEYPNISNIEQLSRAADADIDVETFQYEQYTITRPNDASLRLQDTVFLFEPGLVPEAEAPRPAGIAVWSSIVQYEIDNLVEESGVFYIAIKASLNQIPPNPEFWKILDDPVKNTKSLFVGEIELSVTNEKELYTTATLIKRIPRKES